MEKTKIEKTKIELPFRYKRIKNRFLLTNDFFDWIFLDNKDFELVLKKKVDSDSPLYKRLKERNFIIDDAKHADKIIDIKKQQSSLLYTGPSLHIIVLTKRCNHKCVYCHAAAENEKCKEKYDLSKKDAKRFVEIIMSSPNKFLTIEFQGGEPLLNWEILKYICEYSQELNKNLSEKKKKELAYAIVTNLERMDDEKLDYLIKKGVRICTSLDGHKELHDKNRPSANIDSSYENVTSWIKKGEEKGTRMGALITVSRSSLAYPKEIVDEYINQGYSMAHIRGLNFLGSAVGAWKNIGYTAEEFIEFWKKSMDYIIEINKQGRFFTERTCTIMLQKIISRLELNFLDLMSPCGAAIGQVAYNYNGKIYTCDEARALEDDDMFQIGDTETESIPKMVTSQKALDIVSSTINDSYYCDYCAYKPYCGICPVCHYGETGNPISDVLKTSRCKIKMAQFDYIFEKLLDPNTRDILVSWMGEKFYKEGIIFE